MKYIEFATRPEIQAALFKIQTLGPVNRRAFEHLSPERARQLPSHPDNLKRAILINPEWLAQRDASGKSNVEKNVEMWNEFASK
jgi:putative spermidine/putrescine transport system substrate-binding protein